MAQGKKPRSGLTVFEVLQSGFDQNSSKNKGLSKAKDSKTATKEVRSQPTAELSSSPEMEQECREMHAFQRENQGSSLQGQKLSDDATTKNQNASKHNEKKTPCKISNM